MQSVINSERQHYKKAKLYGNVAMGLSMAAVAWGFIGIIIAIGVTSQVFPGFQFPCICISSKYAVYECGKCMILSHIPLLNVPDTQVPPVWLQLASCTCGCCTIVIAWLLHTKLHLQCRIAHGVCK